MVAILRHASWGSPSIRMANLVCKVLGGAVGPTNWKFCRYRWACFTGIICFFRRGSKDSAEVRSLFFTSINWAWRSTSLDPLSMDPRMSCTTWLLAWIFADWSSSALLAGAGIWSSKIHSVPCCEACLDLLLTSVHPCSFAAFTGLAAWFASVLGEAGLGCSVVPFWSR